MHDTELVFKKHCSNKRMKLDPDTVSVSGPFTTKSHKVTDLLRIHVANDLYASTPATRLAVLISKG